MSAVSPTRLESRSAMGMRRHFLNDVSRDIADLEQYFLRSALRLPVRISFSDSGLHPERAGNYVRVEEVVAWEPIGRRAEWRLTYRKTRRITKVTSADGTDRLNPERSVTLEHCPLVEAPAVDRVRAHRALPELLQEAGARS